MDLGEDVIDGWITDPGDTAAWRRSSDKVHIKRRAAPKCGPSIAVAQGIKLQRSISYVFYSTRTGRVRLSLYRKAQQEGEL